MPWQKKKENISKIKSEETTIIEKKIFRRFNIFKKFYFVDINIILNLKSV